MTSEFTKYIMYIYLNKMDIGEYFFEGCIPVVCEAQTTKRFMVKKRETKSKGAMFMVQDKEKTLKIYEVPMLQVTYFSDDILVANNSPETGSEYPGDLWG